MERPSSGITSIGPRVRASSTELVQEGNSFFLNPIAGGTGPSIKYQGAVVIAGAFNGWTPIGAEALPGGDYEIAWRNGGLQKPGRGERTPISLPPGIEL